MNWVIVNIIDVVREEVDLWIYTGRLCVNNELSTVLASPKQIQDMIFRYTIHIWDYSLAGNWTAVDQARRGRTYAWDTMDSISRALYVIYGVVGYLKYAPLLYRNILQWAQLPVPTIEHVFDTQARSLMVKDPSVFIFAIGLAFNTVNFAVMKRYQEIYLPSLQKN